MSRIEALHQYQKAMKLGQKCCRSAISKGESPYLPALDKYVDTTKCSGSQDLGLVEIPMELIVGTKSPGREAAFAANFMPVLDEGSEFAAKWICLCQAHLGDEGIREPIRCVEYLGLFYVVEGNKRVSVLRSYEASTIPGYVTRLTPLPDVDPQLLKLYEEFTDFYQLAGLYQIRFTRPGCYAKLQAALGYDPDHKWAQDERRVFQSRYTLFRNVFYKLNGQSLDLTVADALLVWLRVYPFQDLRDMTVSQLQQSLRRIWPDLLLLEKEDAVSINTQPVLTEKGFLGQILGSTRSHLDVAFLFGADPQVSAFTRSHELGADNVQQLLGSRITVKKYYGVKPDDSGYQIMEQAMAEGADVIIATDPPLVGNCRKIAARHPQVKVLNCALSLPYAGVRTYYSRIYEAKFITGALCAAFCREERIGYVANYPILGVPAGINAFALGARMVNPNVRIQLEWQCVPGYPYEAFSKNGVRMITNREIPEPGERHWCWDWGTYYLQHGAEPMAIASPSWNWGRFYEQVLISILDGGWNDVTTKDSPAVSYWWGLDSGVIDVEISPDLPDGIQRLGHILKQGIIDGMVDPFAFRLVDQQGRLRSDGSQPLRPEEIMAMDWLCDCVDGKIPSFEEMKPVAQNVVRVLGIYRDSIPPEKEAVLL